MGITRTHLLSGLCLLILSSAVHLLPFVLYGAHPLGYDTGFYRRYLTQPLVSFPNTVVPGLGDDALVPRLILDTTRLLHLPPDVTLYGTYLLWWLLLPLILYVWVRPYMGTAGALLASLLFVLSPVAYTAYSFMLYKNAFALCLLILALIAYDRRMFSALAFLDVMLAFSHKTTAIVYIATLLVLLLLERSRAREIAMHLGLTIGTLLLATSAGAAVTQAASGSTVAVFLSWSEYVTLSFGLLLALMLTLPVRAQLFAHRSLSGFAAVTLAFPLLRLPFYERIFVYTDVALVTLAVYGLLFAWRSLNYDTRPRKSYMLFILLCVIAGFQLGNLQHQILSLQPLVSPDALRAISAVGTALPSKSYVLTSNGEAPWYQGWTTAHIIAPGMLHDRHNFDAWAGFWQATTTSARISFLNTFPTPLYVSTTVSIDTLVPNAPQCLKKISSNLWRSDCAQAP